MKQNRSSRKAIIQLVILLLLCVVLVYPYVFTRSEEPQQSQQPFRTTTAWLQAVGDGEPNVFVGSSMVITTKGAGTFKLLPGAEIAVTSPNCVIQAGSEAGYLFSRCIESGNFGDYVTWQYNNMWTAVPGNAGYYYRTFGTAGQQLTVNQNPYVFPTASGQNDILGNSKGNGYVTAREYMKDGTTDINTNNLDVDAQDAGLTAKFCYVQLSGLSVEEAFAVAKPHL